jgi:hypothetical protein
LLGAIGKLYDVAQQFVHHTTTAFDIVVGKWLAAQKASTWSRALLISPCTADNLRRLRVIFLASSNVEAADKTRAGYSCKVGGLD